jgi:hypothetical protein
MQAQGERTMAMETSRLAGKPVWQYAYRPRRISTEPPGKGAYGGGCGRIECTNEPSYWFNATNGKYYCSACARRFNEISARHGEEPLCELHP